jgi:hypothetical protein
VNDGFGADCAFNRKDGDLQALKVAQQDEDKEHNHKVEPRRPRKRCVVLRNAIEHLRRRHASQRRTTRDGPGYQRQ